MLGIGGETQVSFIPDKEAFSDTDFWNPWTVSTAVNKAGDHALWGTAERAGIAERLRLIR